MELVLYLRWLSSAPSLLEEKWGRGRKVMASEAAKSRIWNIEVQEGELSSIAEHYSSTSELVWEIRPSEQVRKVQSGTKASQ